MTEQWCVTRGCVALADSPVIPFFCRVHGAMTISEREEWSREHSFQAPVLQPVTDRIERDAEGQPVRFYPRTR